MKLQSDRKGYKVVELMTNGRDTRKTCKVHRLVAQAYLPNLENKPQVNHMDGNVANNKVGNLEWVTNEENMKHSQAGRSFEHTVGHNNPKFKSWSYKLYDEDWVVMDKTTIEEFCKTNKFDKSTLYAYIDTDKQITRGKMRGYRFKRSGL